MSEHRAMGDEPSLREIVADLERTSNATTPFERRLARAVREMATTLEWLRRDMPYAPTEIVEKCKVVWMDKIRMTLRRVGWDEEKGEPDGAEDQRSG